MILFTKPYLTIEHNADLACITQHWKGFAKSEEFREGIKSRWKLSGRRGPTRSSATRKTSPS
jgi:hypothetical protein